MVSQLRIYTINRGMMDSWLELFHEHLKPNHEKYGIPIDASWVNADRTEFITGMSCESRTRASIAGAWASSTIPASKDWPAAK